MPKASMPRTVAGYSVLPVSLPVLPSYSTRGTHYIYAQPHKPNSSDAATPRSLFLVNVPPDANEPLLKHLLSEQLGLSAGRINAVRFEDARHSGAGTPATAAASASHTAVDAIAQEGGKGTAKGDRKAREERKRKRDELERDEMTANSTIEVLLPATWDREIHRAGSNVVVEFVDRESMKEVLGAIANLQKKNAPVWGDGLRTAQPALGLERYATHHRFMYPSKQELLTSVNNYMTMFAEREAAKARAGTRKRNEPDDDGFITVTRGGRNGVAKKEEAEQTLEKQREKSKGFNDFYRFQAREKMKQRAGELVKRFEEDKEKIRKMKEQRGKFRPE